MILLVTATLITIKNCCLSIGAHNTTNEVNETPNESDLMIISDDEWREILASLPPPPVHSGSVIQQHAETNIHQQAIQKGSKILIMKNCNIQSFHF
jgi:hypothetical protein